MVTDWVAAENRTQKRQKPPHDPFAFPCLLQLQAVRGRTTTTDRPDDESHEPVQIPITQLFRRPDVNIKRVLQELQSDSNQFQGITVTNDESRPPSL